MSWENDAEGLQYTQTEQTSLGKFWWSHGKKVQKIMVSGRFYTSGNMFNAPPSSEWISSDLYSDEGWETPAVRIAPLLKRSQPFTQDSDGNKTWLLPSEYKKGITKIYTEILCMMQGYPDPVILTCKGWTAARICGAKRSVFTDHKALIIDEANKTAKSPLPPYAFWMDIGGAYGKDGKPVFVDVSKEPKNELHDIILQRTAAEHIPEALRRSPDDCRAPANRTELVSLYVGKESLYELTAIREQYITDGWDKHLRSNFRQDESQQQSGSHAHTPVQQDSSEFDAF